MQQIKDALGRIFDPAKHMTRKGTNEPVTNRFGVFMPRGGRKPKEAATAKPGQEPAAAPAPSAPHTPPPVNAATSSPAPAADPAPGTVPEPPPPSFDDVGAALRSIPKDGTPEAAAEALQEEIVSLPDNPTAETIIGIIQTGLMLIGEEEGILTETEKTLVRRPLVRVLEKYEVGAKMMPPEVDLSLAVLGLFLVRIQKPKTATTWLKLKTWALNFWFARKGAKLAADIRREVGPPPQSVPPPAPQPGAGNNPGATAAAAHA